MIYNKSRVRPTERASKYSHGEMMKQRNFAVTLHTTTITTVALNQQ